MILQGLQDFDLFFDLISSQCQTLERFEYIGDNTFGLNGLSYDPSKDKDKFPSLKYIKIEFQIGPGYALHESESVALMAELEKFKNYLSTKCPKLENPIQLDLKKEEIVLTEVGTEQPLGPHTRYDKATFESK